MARYNKHVNFTGEYLVFNTAEFRGPDLFLGVLMLVCCSVGIVGNCTALRFFFLRRKAHITTSIFIAIAFVDVCTGKCSAIMIHVIFKVLICLFAFK